MQILPQLSESFVSFCSRLPSATRTVFKQNEVIYVTRPEHKTYVIKRGYVRLVYVQPDGRTWTRMVLGKGAMIGDLPFQPGFFLRDEQATASGTVCLLEIDRLDLEDRSVINSEFQLLLLKTTAAQLQFVDRRMQWQLISPLRSRVALALADLMCFAGDRCGHGHLVDVRLTHEEFSQLVIAARPAVSELLKEFKTAGMIDYTRSHLCLLDLDGLHSIAGILPHTKF